MKLKYWSCLTAVGLSLLSQVVFANDTITYKNARGSTLVLEFGADNTLTGAFTTAVASKECQQAIGMKRPVVGYMAKNAIAFSVNYPECGSVISFTGNIEKDKALIDTTAIVAHHSPQIATEGPRMLWHDLFTRI